MSHINPKELEHDLTKIIEEGVSRYPIPAKKGNSIRVKSVIVRRNKYGYHMFDLQDKQYHDYTSSLVTALAIAHTKAIGDTTNSIDHIKHLDNKLSKYYNDAMFYNHTINNADCEIRRSAAEMRYDIALDEVRRIKEQIEEYIFDK